MTDLIKNAKLNRNKAYAQFANSHFWKENLKPDLEAIMSLEGKYEVLPLTSFEAVKRDIKRAVTNMVILKIIKMIEKAEHDLEKKYR